MKGNISNPTRQQERVGERESDYVGGGKTETEKERERREREREREKERERERERECVHVCERDRKAVIERGARLISSGQTVPLAANERPGTISPLFP